MVWLDQRVVEEHKELLDQLVFLDPLEKSVHQVQLGLLVSLVLLVLLERRVHLGFVEIMDHRDAKEKEAKLGLLEALETRGTLARMDPLVLMVHQVQLEQQDKEELLVFLDREESVEC